MEFVDGGPLTGPMPTEVAMPVARQICEGLQAVHRQGIVHRDLKPANILIGHDGDREGDGFRSGAVDHVDDKAKKHKDLKDVYKREKSSRKRIDDSEALQKQQTLRDLESAIHWKDRRKFLEFLRTAGISDGSEKFLQLVELYDRLHSRW